MASSGRVENRTLRTCYLCEAIFGQPGVFESESLYHMLMVCPHHHASMLNARERLKNDVKNKCQVDASPLSPKPPEFGESEMVIMLCTTAPISATARRPKKARNADTWYPCYLTGGESESARYALCLLYTIGLE